MRESYYVLKISYGLCYLSENGETTPRLQLNVSSSFQPVSLKNTSILIYNYQWSRTDNTGRYTVAFEITFAYPFMIHFKESTRQQ